MAHEGALYISHVSEASSSAFTVGGPEHHGRHLLASRVAGVGVGVFLLFFFLALSLVICLVGSRTKTPMMIYFASAAMFGTVALVLLVTPKGERPPKPEFGYDKTIIPLIIIMVLVSIFVLLGGVGMLVLHVLPPVYARPLSYHMDIERRR